MKALVTGGSGFLGQALIRRLLERGDSARSLSRSARFGLAEPGVEILRGDVADPEAVSRAVQGTDVVFHTAAKAGVWGPPEEFTRTNVAGTRHVVEACRRHGVRRLVFTSSPSVVFDGKDMEGADESAPYPPTYAADYPRSKAEAERLVLAANGPELATLALRPHLIWGPGDNHLVPRIVERARAGRLLRLSGPVKKVDSTFIDNAAEAHLLAADRLAPGAPPAGKAYFISNGEPLPLWELVDRLLAAAHLPPLTRSVPPRLAYAAGWAFEKAYGFLDVPHEPPMTRFVAEELSTSHWFDLSAAKRDLGYQPRISIEEGLRRLEEAFKQGGCSGS